MRKTKAGSHPTERSLFKGEHQALVCVSVISKRLGAIKQIEERSFMEEIRRLMADMFKVRVVGDRELQNYFKGWVEKGLMSRQPMPGDRRKTFYVINPARVRTENMTVIELGDNDLLIHDSVAGVLLEGRWARRYNVG